MSAARGSARPWGRPTVSEPRASRGMARTPRLADGPSEITAHEGQASIGPRDDSPSRPVKPRGGKRLRLSGAGDRLQENRDVVSLNSYSPCRDYVSIYMIVK